MGASVVTTASMVAMAGWIIPEPLAMPPTVKVRPPTWTRAAASLGRVSVVMIARAARVADEGPASRSSAPTAAAIRSAGSAEPMRPVEAGSTWASSQPRRAATAATTRCAAAIPAAPVPAFAQPALMTTARALPPLDASAPQASCTGAAAKRLRVKKPAAATDRSATTSATSSPLPCSRSPALAAPALKPPGARMPPSAGAIACLTGRPPARRGRRPPAGPGRRSCSGSPGPRRPCPGCRWRR